MTTDKTSIFQLIVHLMQNAKVALAGLHQLHVKRKSQLLYPDAYKPCFLPSYTVNESEITLFESRDKNILNLLNANIELPFLHYVLQSEGENIP